MKSFKTIGLLFVVFIFGIANQLKSQINFPLNSQYRYLKGSNASTLSSDWVNNSFDDSLWPTGNAPFRYGDGTGGTELTDMQNGYSTLYLRAKFNATSIDRINELTFTTDYDDGFIIWINGSEVFRRSAPETSLYNSFASENHESGTPVTIKVDSGMVNLIEGENIIAIQGFNVSLESTDFYFDLQISAAAAQPEVSDSLKVLFNKSAGFYSSPFNLMLTSPDNTLNIKYTIDGSNPQSSATAITAGTSVQVTVDPSISSGRAATPAFIVRASLTKAGLNPSKPVTQTFIFIESVKNQVNPGGNWPTYDINGQILRFPMSQNVVGNTSYSGLIDDALLDIQTISIVTDLENLFDPSVGIYVNAWGHGLDWEKFCSVELIDPDGAEGFQVNAGLRIRGGWSRHNDYPKHAFRLFFREEYGVAKLKYPLFADEGVDEFDKIDLRCEQNYSWANWGDVHNTMIREVFSRDSQRDMGQPYTRSRYYHLYLNGMYWGIYQTQERSEARYAADYLGGNREDYDVVKVSTENWSYQIEATDGVTTTWQQIYNLCNTGFTDNAQYYKLEGKDANGIPVPGEKVLVNIDNLIDYMLTIFYTGNFDAPTSSFGGNDGPNNFYAIYNREELSQGYIFLNHDGEHAMMVEALSPGTGLYENRVSLPDMNVNGFYSFHPQWLHQKLTENAEYRQRFADRIALHMTNNGALTPSKCLERFNKRVDEIDIAVIAESARWGDLGYGTRTKDNAWIPEIKTVQDEFLPVRTSIVLDQLEQADLYSSFNPPVIYNSSTVLKDTRYSISGTYPVSIKNPNSTGKIYYTLDGTDPRKNGGKISETAIESATDVTLNLFASAIINARIHNDNGWSPVREIEFFGANDDLSNLKVTELHYHPQDVIEGTDTISGKSFEFIEFKNTGSTSLDISGLVLDSAVYYEFPAGTILAPGKFYVIATKPSYFFERYAKLPSGNCEDFFDNAEEYVLLNDAKGNEILSFTYFDDTPWPKTPDGDGYTLTSIERNPTSSPNDYVYWTSSSTINGSPFNDDLKYVGVEPVMISDAEDEFIVFPNPVKDYLYLGLREAQNNLVTENRVTIINLNGSMVFENLFEESMTIDLNSLGIPAGLYILKIENESYTQTEKFIYQP